MSDIWSQDDAVHTKQNKAMMLLQHKHYMGAEWREAQHK